MNDRVGSILLSRLMGAEVRLDPSGFGIGCQGQLAHQALEDVRSRGGRPYGIPAGASDHRSGGLGFAGWADEVRQQEGSTHAGMIAGFAAQKSPRRVIGIDASARIDETRGQVERTARRTAELIGLRRDLKANEITSLL